MSGHEDKFLPRPTPLTEPWWEACRREELLIQRCAHCSHRQFYPRTLCTACGSGTVEWIKASGRGRVKSWTVIRRPVSSAYKDEVPYVLALVELAEGPVMMSTLDGCGPADVTVDMPVEVTFERWTDEVTVPRFRAAAES